MILRDPPMADWTPADSSAALKNWKGFMIPLIERQHAAKLAKVMGRKAWYTSTLYHASGFGNLGFFADTLASMYRNGWAVYHGATIKRTKLAVTELLETERV